MIHGVGVDVVAVSGFGEQLARPGTALRSSFTAAELRDAAGDDRDAAAQTKHLAARWAAKEAVIKAWSGGRFGRGLITESVPPRDVEVRTDAWGRPAVRLRGVIGQALEGARIHLSLSHDGDVATAFVVIETD